MSQLLHLGEFNLNGSGPAENLHRDSYAALLHADFFNDTGETGEGTVRNLDSLSFREALFGSECLFSLEFSGLLKNVVHLILGKGKRTRCPSGSCAGSAPWTVRKPVTP